MTELMRPKILELAGDSGSLVDGAILQLLRDLSPDSTAIRPLIVGLLACHEFQEVRLHPYG